MEARATGSAKEVVGPLTPPTGLRPGPAYKGLLRKVVVSSPFVGGEITAEVPAAGGDMAQAAVLVASPTVATGLGTPPSLRHRAGAVSLLPLPDHPLALGTGVGASVATASPCLIATNTTTLDTA